MTHSEDIAQELRRAGLRITPQRLMIIDAVFHHKGHLTADEIYQRIQEQYPYVDLSTVYRTLQVLKEQGLVAEFQMPDGSREYESLLDGRHHHAVCHQCGAQFEIEDQALEPIRRHLMNKYGFQADLTHMAIFGLCRSCRRAEGLSPDPEPVSSS